MPSSVNPSRLELVLDGLRALGVDNLSVYQTGITQFKCDVGWGTLRVTGVGVDSEAAILDANSKMRTAIADAFPALNLPPDA